MATIPEEISNRIWLNCQELINIIDTAKSAEYILFTKHGEIENTINDLDTLQNIAEATNNYQRLTNVTLRTATIQPQAGAATISILTETISEVEASRMAARLRSLEEIVIEWRLADE